MSNEIKKEEIKSLWKEQLDELFLKKNENEMHDFFSILTIMMNGKYDEKLVCLYELINNVSLFSSIIDEFSGLDISIPNKEDFMDTLKIALAFYYKEIKNMSWKEIQKEIPYEDHIALKASKGIVKMKKELKNQLSSILKE